MPKSKQKPQPRVVALLPIAVFLVFYLGCGIFFEYISPIPDQMGFYVVSVVVAFCIALVVAFLQNRALRFEDKIGICAQGVGDKNIVMMLFIFLMAGAFSGIASASGGAEATANMLLNVIPPAFALPGIFLIAALISLAMGTSVGTITVLVPIAVQIAAGCGLDLALCVGVSVGGAMFGDNLSFISDTTIAATRTQGCRMADKFHANFRIALPAALLTLAVLVGFALTSGAATLEAPEFNLWLALPYFLVLAASIAGINVFVVLGIGILIFGVLGIGLGTLDFSSAFLAMGEGTSGMFETMIVTILVASISALVKEYGGFQAILSGIRRMCRSAKGGMLGIGVLTAFMDIACANNTVAIVVSSPIAKEIGDEYGIEPKRVASLMDIFSCVAQGIIPYGAQLLIAAGLAGLASVQLMAFCYYQLLLLACTLVWIFARGNTALEA